MTIIRDKRVDGLPLQIDGHGYVLDTGGFQRNPIAAQRQLVDDGEEPGDRTINGQGSWKRTQWSFDHGAGQTWWDEDQDTDRRQFASSLGVDVWDRRELTLLKDTTQVEDLAVTRLHAAGDSVYAIHDNGAVTHSHDPWSAWSPGSPIGAIDVCWDGDWAYLAHTGGIIRTDAITDLDLTWSSVVVDRLFLSGGRLIGIRASDGHLVEFENNGTATSFDQPIGAREFKGLVDMGGETYSWDWPVTLSTENGGDDPDVGVPDLNRRSVLYRHSLNEDSTAFLAGDAVLELPPGEHIHAAHGYANIIVLGTNKGIRIAQATSGNNFAHGGLIAIPNPAGWDANVIDFCSDGQYIWFTWTQMSDGKSGLGRLDLDEFIEVGVAAYATDLHFPIAYATGETRVTSCAIVEGRLIIGGSFGAYVEATTHVATGELRTGWINYGSPERKAVLGLGLRSQPLPAGSEIRGSVHVDKGVEQEYGLVSLQGEGAITANGSLGEPGAVSAGEEFDVHLRLIRGTDGSSPNLRRWTLRALPLPFRAEEIVLPVIIQHSVKENNVAIHQDPDELLARLRDLYRSRRIVRIDIGNESMMGYIDGVGIDRDSSVTKTRGWSKRRSSLTGIYAVTVITTDIPVEEHRRVSDSEIEGDR